MNIGVIGVGKLGEFHTKLLTEIAQDCRDLHCAGVFDLDSHRAEEMAAKYRVASFSSLEVLAKSCDAAIIATTTSSHYEIARILLGEGLHLFIEKPITTTVEEADELIRLEAKNRVHIQVGHIERFNPALRAVEAHIGRPLYIQAERLSGFSRRVTDVSVVLDLMIHDIDLVLSLIPSEIKHISASGVKVFSNELDMATARIDFVNGATANVTASRLSRIKMRKLRFFAITRKAMLRSTLQRANQKFSSSSNRVKLLQKIRSNPLLHVKYLNSSEKFTRPCRGWFLTILTRKFQK